MDVPPPWFVDWTRPTCTGESRRCGPLDEACRTKAIADGFVFYNNYTACRSTELHTTPGVASYVLGGGGAVILFVVFLVVLIRHLRARRGDAVPPR